ncbi:MAG TPA: nitroreductase family protein [Gaiellaceae bacterium]
MSLYELLRQRRMVRHYTGERVAREVLERIVATVRRAPSAGFSQGQRLLVVDDPALLAKLDEADAPEGMEPWFATAAAHVLVLTREQDYHDRYTSPDKLDVTGGTEIDWPVPYWHVDAGAALMLVLLAALEEGLAAGVYGIPLDDQPRVRELLHIPDELAIVAGITLGRRAPDPGWSKAASRATQRRRTLDEVVHWNTWD